MKQVIIAMLCMLGTAAFGQTFATVANNQPQIFEIPSHVEHASVQPLATPQYILEGSTTTSAKGVQPLWEFPSENSTVPLGDRARAFRKERLTAKKAQKVLSDQL